MKKKLLTIFLVISFSLLKAQFTLPPADIQLKPGGNVFGVNSSNNQFFVAIDITGSLYVHVNQYLAGGFFLSRSVWGEYQDEGNVEVGSNRGVFSSGFTPPSSTPVVSEGIRNDADLFIYGISVRLSTGRIGKWRPYLNLNYFKLEIVNHFENFNLSAKSNGFGVDFGLMLQLSNKLYLNLIEASIKNLQDDIFFMEQDLDLIQARIGVTYNFGKSR